MYTSTGEERLERFQPDMSAVDCPDPWDTIGFNQRFVLAAAAVFQSNPCGCQQPKSNYDAALRCLFVLGSPLCWTDPRESFNEPMLRMSLKENKVFMCKVVDAQRVVRQDMR
jgi:hypothetical protein